MANGLTYAFIPARGNSKRVPGKNKRLLAGRPLIYYTLKVALLCEEIDMVCVSSEDEELLLLSGDIAAELGQSHKLMRMTRDKRLAMDHVQTDEVALDMLRRIEAIPYVDNPETIVMLAPTSPLRTADTLARALDEWEESGNGEYAKCVITVNKITGWFYSNSWEAITGTPAFREGTQEATENFVLKENGSVYITSARVLSKYRSYRIYPWILLEDNDTVDVDTLEDWDEAEKALESKE